MDENTISESEVAPKEIINQMKVNIFPNYSLYNNSLINIDYLLYRPSIFSLIHKISNRIGFKSQTYFLSIYYLDILHIKHQKINLDLKLLSLACLTLSAKYAENDKNVPNLSFFVAIFNSFVEYSDIISIQELIFAEVLACKLLEYKLNYFTVYDFDSFFFSHGIIKIEQLKELNNNFNDLNSEMGENSYYIRKILEKIYRKSRYYLDRIVNNGNICLKYSSLIISVVIMKKSVEDILIEEKDINDNDIKELKEKASICFKEIMKEIYQINYESSEEYQNLIIDNDLQNIFQYKNKKLTDYIHNNKNFKFIRNKKDNLNNNRYQSLVNKTSNVNPFIKKLDISQNIEKYNNFRRQNESGIESEEGDFLYFNRYRKERISVPKRYINSKHYFDLTKFNSTFSNNFNHSKRNRLNRNIEDKNKIRNISLSNRHSEINGLINYVHTYTNDFYPKTRKESNSISKINMKNIKINDSLEEPQGIINTLVDNNISLPNDNILNTVTIEKGKYYNKYKKLVLKKRFFNRINMHNRLQDYSISQLDNSTALQNKDTFDEKNPMQNFNKPYFKKIIKNITNFSTKQNQKVISFFSTMNDNMYNPNRTKKNKIILLNQFPYNNNTYKNELNYENKNEIKENKLNITIDSIKNNEQRNTLDKKIVNKKNYMLNQRKKIYSNNILLNSTIIDDNNNTQDIKNEKEDILLTTNDDYLNKKNERQKLLFNRMKNINNKINFKNNINNTEIKNNEYINKIPLKTKYILLNNNKNKKDDLENNNNIQSKDKIYENQIVNKNEINKLNLSKINNSNIIKELNPNSLRFKYLNKKNPNLYENSQDQNKTLQKEIKKEYTNYPNSTIIKLINKAKRINENKLNISKEELNTSLINNFKSINKNKKNKIMNSIEINQFNTLDNETNKKENNIEEMNIPNKNVIHGYHYRNYMKNKIKKDKDNDKNKKENSKTIVINNNININFNNKIENSKIYPNKNEIMKKQVTTKMADSKEIFNKMIINKNTGDYHKRETIDYINNNIDKTHHNNVSSLMHRLPFYKKSSEFNKNKYSNNTNK